MKNTGPMTKEEKSSYIFVEQKPGHGFRTYKHNQRRL